MPYRRKVHMAHGLRVPIKLTTYLATAGMVRYQGLCVAGCPTSRQIGCAGRDRTYDIRINSAAFYL